VNRRAFLLGLIGSTATAVAPQTIDRVLLVAPSTENAGELYLRQWYFDAMPILMRYQSDILIFGCAAMRYTDKYPFVECVDPAEIIWVKS
jgi:hypothetical protein